MYLVLFSVAVLGAIVGSFINALVFRFRLGEGMMGRSHCMACNHTLSALDLVPFFSFAFLRGRCRYCGVSISAQYPFIEAVGALLAVGVFLVNPLPLPFLIAFFFWMTVLFATVYDFRYQELPNNALIVCSVLGLASLFIQCSLDSCVIVVPTVFSMLAGPIVALPLFAISALSSERAMGWGDGFFILGFGWLLGVTGGFSALCIGVWSGAIVGLIMIAMEGFIRKYTSPQLSPSQEEGAGQKNRVMHTKHSANEHVRVTMKSKIPFAPFITLGALAVYFLHANFLAVLSAF